MYEPSPSVAFSPADAAFLRDEARAANTRIAFANLGAERGSTPQLQDLALNMVKDAQKDLANLDSVAESAGVALPHQTNQGDGQALAVLSSLSGQAFDEQFAIDVQADAKRELTQLDQGERSLTNPGLQSTARDLRSEAHAMLRQTRYVWATAQPYDDHGAGQSW